MELEHPDVLLVPREDRLDRAGGVREGDRKDSRHAGIQGPGVARLRDGEHVPDPGAHLVGRRAGRLVDDGHPEADPLLDRPILGAGPVLRIRRLMEDDEIAHPRTRAAIMATISSGVFSPESITKSKTLVSRRSIP